MELTAEKIRSTATAFQQSRILLTGFELGVFSVIGKTGNTSAEIAGKLNTDRRATDRLLNALCAIELLKKQGGKFFNTRGSEKHLVKGQPDYLGNLMHTVDLWDFWSNLTPAVRKGSAPENRPIPDRGEDWVTAFIEAMHVRGMEQAPQIAGLLDLEGVHKILDVGGGSGAFSIGILKRKPDIRAIIFDLPKVIPLTRKYVENESLLDRVDLVSGNYLEDSLGNGFDLIFLSAIVHSNSSAQNKTLISKCAGALNPGGQLVIQDYVMDEDRLNPPRGAIFAINMLVATGQGDTFTEREIRDWLQQAGISEIRRQETPFGASQIIGRK